ncbi:hypothetical protein [Cohnella fermenti]|uniref:Uncharacterized protein n=1 Tax=Cohnella fermenti TaxID=2565925 RepID=A0A4S4BRF1_9BACL|nr:hypothetical protein [Cohnella fermenti]THF77586.1 hypothetical protein E6C55_16350 [Cohnella fermenti]
MMGTQSFGAQSTSVTRCSLVVRTTDIWTGRPAVPSTVRVRLKGVPAAPLRTSDRSWAFLDLPHRLCDITVESGIYLPCSQQVDLSALAPGDPVVELFLLPGRAYVPFAAAAGIVRILVDENGKPAAGVEVFAYVDDDQAARGRILDEEVLPGSKTLRCVPGATKLLSGDALAVRGKDGAPAEWFRVSPVRLSPTQLSTNEGDGLELRLDRPALHRWSRNHLLLPAAATVSDGDGWIVLPFRGRLSAGGSVRIVLRRGGKEIEDRWPLAEGKTTVMPDYVLRHS